MTRAEHRARAEELLEMAERRCIVGESLLEQVLIAQTHATLAGPDPEDQS
jgi:hypothetical protein